MKRTRMMLLLSLLLTMMLVLAACGGDDADQGSDGGESSDNPAEVVATEATDATEEEPAEDEETGETEEGGETAAGGEGDQCTVTMVADSNLDRDTETLGPFIEQFEADNPGVNVELIPGPESATDRLGQYLQCFAQECSDFDVLQIDVIWPGDLAEHLLDMTPYVDPAVLEQYFPAIVQNNTVDGRLVGIPWFTDAGLMYYRTDLLEKYGYDGPPATWEELTEMAQTIQDGEQAENQDFNGYVWQGNAYEGLTCDAIEWIDSSGGGTIVSPDGVITINNENAIAALERAAGWVGTISPTGVTGFQEEDARNVWHAGNAAFMRNWPYAYSLSKDSTVLCPDGPEGECVFAATPLPRAEGADKGAAALGGWQLGVNAYSACPEAAGRLAAYLSTPEVQKVRAVEATLIPTIESLYEDADVLAAIPAPDVMLEVLQNATPRPSTASAPQYNEVSNIFFTNVHGVLTGEQDAEDAVAEIELELEDLLGFPTGEPGGGQ